MSGPWILLLAAQDCTGQAERMLDRLTTVAIHALSSNVWPPPLPRPCQHRSWYLSMYRQFHAIQPPVTTIKHALCSQDRKIKPESEPQSAVLGTPGPVPDTRTLAAGMISMACVPARHMVECRTWRARDLLMIGKPPAMANLPYTARQGMKIVVRLR